MSAHPSALPSTLDATDAVQVYAVRGRPTGRGRPQGPFLHAVPGTDRTRSALCGARVGGELRPWPGPEAYARRRGLSSATAAGAPSAASPLSSTATCPECAALLRQRAA